jgi:hypothetical protein
MLSATSSPVTPLLGPWVALLEGVDAPYPPGGFSAALGCLTPAAAHVECIPPSPPESGEMAHA